MVSKGVDYYGFIDNDGLPGTTTVEFTGPQVGSTLTSSQNFRKNNLQIESSKLPWYEFDGDFTWTAAMMPGGLIAAKKNRISTVTGNLQYGSQMTNMLSMPPIRSQQGALIDYGFYDAGDGSSGLTNQDQSWVYCTRDFSHWMGDLAAHYPQVHDKQFHNFALPGAHDAGMMTMDTVNALLSSPQSKALLAAIALFNPILMAAIMAVAGNSVPQVIMNASMTQKDTVADMLMLGCRYFDFRPGTMYSEIPGVPGRYHQHLVIPGIAYVGFLTDLLRWLQDHPTEIVVVSCNTQGFAEASMRPSPQDLEADWNAAVQRSGVRTIKAGDASSLSWSYDDLITGGVRVIFLNQIDQRNPESSKYDSYDNAAYATLTPGPIIERLDQMTSKGQEDDTYTVLQLQGTASNAIGYQGFVSKSWTSSPLMSTKALFDTATLPWVTRVGRNNLKAQKLVVLLNDFIDNATAYIAIHWTVARMTS